MLDNDHYSRLMDIRELSIRGGGGRLFVITGQQFFLPHLCMHKKFWSPLGMQIKILVPPFAYTKGVFFPDGGGGQNFFAHAEGGPEFFCTCQGGDQKKLATRDHRQTAPPPGKK